MTTTICHVPGYPNMSTLMSCN